MTTGWTCPKCGRVWGPSVQGCAPCNQSVGLPLSPGSPFAPATTGSPMPQRGQVIAQDKQLCSHTYPVGGRCTHPDCGGL